jgi:hypothetical protein
VGVAKQRKAIVDGTYLNIQTFVNQNPFIDKIPTLYEDRGSKLL